MHGVLAIFWKIVLIFFNTHMEPQKDQRTFLLLKIKSEEKQKCVNL